MYFDTPMRSTPEHRSRVIAVVVAAMLAAVAADAAALGSVGCRLFAIGDIHGDREGAVRALQAARVVDSEGAWVGGCSTLVQTGDIVDRGASSIETLAYFRSLGRQAAAQGGMVVMLLGNHELLNFEGSLEYVHPQELRAAGGAAAWKRAFGPEGEHRAWMENLDVVFITNSTVFVHAGLLPQYAALGPTALNRLARLQIRRGAFNTGVLGDAGPTWTRKLINAAAAHDCDDLDMSLALLGAGRMVVGHTIQDNGQVGQYCGGRLVAIDIAISRAIVGNPGCIELTPNGVIPYYHNKNLVRGSADLE